jgi:hypothetical protein
MSPFVLLLMSNVIPVPTARSPERRQVQRPNPCAGRRPRWSGCHPRSHLCRSPARQAPIRQAQARNDRRCDRLLLGNRCLGRWSRVPARSKSRFNRDHHFKIALALRARFVIRSVHSRVQVTQLGLDRQGRSRTHRPLHVVLYHGLGLPGIGL